jgi:hypothetical protein
MVDCKRAITRLTLESVTLCGSVSHRSKTNAQEASFPCGKPAFSTSKQWVTSAPDDANMSEGFISVHARLGVPDPCETFTIGQLFGWKGWRPARQRNREDKRRRAACVPGKP